MSLDLETGEGRTEHIALVETICGDDYDLLAVHPELQRRGIRGQTYW